ncbi:uncharacterized protein EV420DRAFT_1742768 [Desarmillaria tabescens]|uniref:Uncharacterized protein n=1 Tax=Armillaria tabescens TaxID=1929756 RepID=A0AA39NRB2_ARMTA|nr:uncharacterized protein EV420DRAFT_1742768 [Desarmillaria tabescens]KAK0470417.1 hypothetical protein EV420DRAFT_1742768 [Desarmillaria tabescens]
MDQRYLPLRLVDRYLANHIPATWAPFVSHDDVLHQQDPRDFAYQLLVSRCEWQAPTEVDGGQVRWLFKDLERIFSTRPNIAIESTADAAAVYFLFSKKCHPSLNPTSDYIQRTHHVLILSNLEHIESSDLEHMVFPPEPVPCSEVQIIDISLSDSITGPGSDYPSTLTAKDFKLYGGYPCESRSLQISDISCLNLYQWRHILGRFSDTAIHDSVIFHSRVLDDHFIWIENICNLSLEDCVVGQEVFQALFNRCVNLEELKLQMVTVSQDREQDAPTMEIYPNKSKLRVLDAICLEENDMRMILETLADTNLSNVAPFGVDSLHLESLGDDLQVNFQDVVCEYFVNSNRMRTFTAGTKELKILLGADKTGVDGVCLMNLIVDVWTSRGEIPVCEQLKYVVEFLDGWMPFLPYLKAVKIMIRGDDFDSMKGTSQSLWESLDQILSMRVNPIWMGVDLCTDAACETVAEEIRRWTGERAHVRVFFNGSFIEA